MPTSSFGAIRVPLVDEKGMPTWDFLKKLQEYESKLQTALTLFGQISKSAVIQGRTEGIGTTVQNITPVGKVNSTDNVIDGTGSPLTGGKRGFQALDTNNRLANSFRANAVNISGTPTSSTVLSSAGGAATSVTVAASTSQFGSGAVPYNSGSFDPGVQGSFVAFADDPTYAGGAVTYQFSATASPQTAADGRVSFGKITTSGAASTGGGSTGGSTPGGEGGRGFNEI